MKVVLFSFLFLTAVIGQPREKISDKLGEKIVSKASGETVLVWVFLTDKGDNIDEYFDTPSSVVSSKSLERRGKVASGSSLIDYTDLPLNARYLEALRRNGVNIKRKSKWLNAVSAHLSPDQIRIISMLDFVKRVDLVGTFRKDFTGINEELINSSGRALNRINDSEFDYGFSVTQLEMNNIPAVHQMGINGEGVTICLMDAGFNLLEHEVFDQMNIIAAYDFVNNDPDVDDGNDMGSGSHGTKTLSTIGGFKEGKLIGPAFKSDYILAKTENTDSETPVEEDNWIGALEWADSIGVDVTSTSLSYLDYDLPYQSYTWEDMDGNTALITIAGDLAVKKGIVVVNSAGNNGYNPDRNTLGAPADGDSIIAAGAVDPNGIRVGFSSVGNTVDGRIKPDFMAMGTGVVTASSNFPDGYTLSSGTSFSCPLIAGIAALMLSNNPGLTPMEIREVLRVTSSQSNAPDREYGYGIIDALAAVNNTTVGNNNEPPEIPAAFNLYQNYPNPFNPSTIIRYSLAENTDVQLSLFNILGEKIRTIVEEYQTSGEYRYELNASGLTSGVYIARLTAGLKTASIKITLLK